MRCSAASAPATSSSARGSPRSASASPRAGAARCGGCSRSPSPGRRRASRAARGIYDHQGVSFPLADSAADAAAGRALTLAVCALADDPAADPKLVHGKASMAKLFVSERAWSCADRAVQTFGGRGYMRTNVAERFLRELRVDRIWEGTSEIQRLIVARSMERRGVERLIGRHGSRPPHGPRSIAVVGATPRATPTRTRRCATSRCSATRARSGACTRPTARCAAGPCSRRSPICRAPPTRSSSRSPPPGCPT